ncbi:MAG: hypothetical protein K6T55_06290 [Syntrophobacterales bacterium]|nr:hypothetical protein [Syntrophobacterales bacterium]
MSGSRGKALRAAVTLLLLSLLTAGPVAAAGGGVFARNLPPLFQPVGADLPETSLEAQILGGRPPGDSGRSSPEQALRELLPGILLQERDGGALVKLPQNVELTISFRYGGEARSAPPESQGAPQPLLLRSSLDYSLFPNLQVGLSGFLYHGATDSRYFQRRYGDVALGVGPGVRYDLGRWSLTLQSQYGTRSRDQKEGLQNWFRVWYAF